MKLTLGLVILTTLIAGCQTVRVTGSCPELRALPPAAVEALRKANDPAVDQWVVDLANHYDKLDVCRGVTAKRKR
jgi:hypothetical protein